MNCRLNSVGSDLSEALKLRVCFGWIFVFILLQPSSWASEFSDLKISNFTNIDEIANSDDGMWVISDDMLCKFDPNSRGKQNIPWNEGSLNTVYEQGGILYVCSDNGFYVCSLDQNFQILEIYTNFGGCDLCRPTAGGVYVATKQGLAKYVSQNNFKLVTKVPLGRRRDEPGRIWTLLQTRSGLWIGTGSGLYRYVDNGYSNRLETIAEDMGEIYDLKVGGGFLWIASREGLYRAENFESKSPLIEDQEFEVRPVYSLALGGNNLWLGTSVGLHKLDFRNDSVATPVLENLELIGGIARVLLKDGRLFLATDHGLFSLNPSEEPWRPAIDIKTSDNTYINEPISVSWVAIPLEGRTSSNLLASTVQIINDDTNGCVQTIAPPPGITEATFKLPRGNYSLVIQLSDLFGHKVQSDKVRFRVRRRISDVILMIVKDSAIVYTCLSIAICGALVIGARWSRLCFALLTDVRVRRLTLYFGIVMEYVFFIRIWVFERYFRKLKEQYGPSDYAYIPVELVDSNGKSVSSKDLLSEMHSLGKRKLHIWIRGGPGTGKTELLHSLVRQYCAEPTLARANKVYGFIPIIIHLRDFRTGDLVQLAGNSLESFDFLLNDKSLLSRLLNTGAFALFVDGLNEAGMDEDVREFNLKKPLIPLLATSQTIPSNLKMLLCQMPSLGTDFEKRLLVAILEKESSQDEDVTKLLSQVDQVPDKLWTEIESALEVRILARMIRNKSAIPADRKALYENVFKQSIPADYPENVICGFAWDAWIKRIRRFPIAQPLTQQIIDPLREARIVIPRGKDLEFRHDLMRGFLAAYYLAKYMPSQDAMMQKLIDKRIWDLDRPDQDLVWPFFTDLIEKDILRTVAQFASAEPGIRIILFEACKRTSQKNNWNVEITI